MMFTQLWRMALIRTGRVQWASSWSNAQRRDTISQPASLPIAKASTPPRSFSRAFTALFVGPSMNGLPRKPAWVCEAEVSPRSSPNLEFNRHVYPDLSGLIFSVVQSHPYRPLRRFPDTTSTRQQGRERWPTTREAAWH